VSLLWNDFLFRITAFILGFIKNVAIVKKKWEQAEGFG
jgi:hypothetical protein